RRGAVEKEVVPLDRRSDQAGERHDPDGAQLRRGARRRIAGGSGSNVGRSRRDIHGRGAPYPVHCTAVYLSKKAFIDEHRLVIWRFSDHWLARKPNELAKALADALGWAKQLQSGPRRPAPGLPR